MTVLQVEHTTHAAFALTPERTEAKFKTARHKDIKLKLNAPFEDVLAALNNLFGVTDSVCFRIGKMYGPDVYSFSEQYPTLKIYARKELGNLGFHSYVIC